LVRWFIDGFYREYPLIFTYEILMSSPNSTMSRTASRITRSMVPRSLGVSRSLVVLSSLGCYMQEYRRSLPLLAVYAANHTKEVLSIHHLVPPRDAVVQSEARGSTSSAARGNVYDHSLVAHEG
jgi:hypothetical protein